jgi:hypothetical protein
MSSPTLIIGDGNWAVKSGSLLGYEYGELSGQFAPIPITGSRASSATYTNQAGTIVSASNDILRVDYTYTTPGSLLLEPQRTNSIRNSTMQGASLGNPGVNPTNWDTDLGGTWITAIGTENGLNYIDYRVSGSAGGPSDLNIRFETSTQISASISQSWTSTFYAKLVSGNTGSLDFVNLISEFNSGGGFLTFGTSSIVLTSTLTRFAFTRTNTNASTARIRPSLDFFLNGSDYDFTIRIAAPQLESGSYPTTYIPTTTTAVTRIADTFSRSNIYTDGYITSGGGTWFVELRNNIPYLRDTFTTGIYISDTTNLTSNNINIRNGGGTVRLAINKVISGSSTPLYLTTTDTVKLAIKWNGSTMDIFQNGTKVISATSFTPTNMGFLRGELTQVPTFIQAMELYPIPLSDAECIALTTL